MAIGTASEFRSTMPTCAAPRSANSAAAALGAVAGARRGEAAGPRPDHDAVATPSAAISSSMAMFIGAGQSELGSGFAPFTGSGSSPSDSVPWPAFVQSTSRPTSSSA